MNKNDLGASLFILALAVVFGLIACFANTQSTVIILLYGVLSLMYAGRAAAISDFYESIKNCLREKLLERKFL